MKTVLSRLVLGTLFALAVSAPPPLSASDDFQGTVLEDSTGTPVASAEIKIRRAGIHELAADLDSDRQGHFAVSGLPPGDYTIEVSKPNYAATSFPYSLPSNPVSVRLVRFAIIEGQVMAPGGRPLTGRIREPGGRTSGGARVLVLTKSPAGDLRTFRDTELGENGHFRFHDLPPGLYAIGLWYSGQEEGAGMQLYPETAHPRFFTVFGGEEYTAIDFIAVPRPLVEIRGKLNLPPVNGRFQLALGLPEQPTVAIAQTLSKDDGTFVFEKIPAGVYDLFAGGPTAGYGAFDSILAARGETYFGRTRISVTGQNIDDVTLTVTPSKSLAVILRSGGAGKIPEGCPSAARLTLTPLEPWAIMFFTAAHASFAKEQIIPGLAPGGFRVGVTDLGPSCFQLTEPIVDLSSTQFGPAVIELATAASLRGMLRPATTPPASVIILLTPVGTNDPTAARIAFPDPRGQFSFDGLRPARCRLATYPSAENSRARWISGRTRGVEIDLTSSDATPIELAVSPPEGGLQ